MLLTSKFYSGPDQRTSYELIKKMELKQNYNVYKIN